MISLNVYLSTTGGGKRDIMKAFGEGAIKHGVEVSYVEQHNYIKSDYAMVFAYKSEGTDSPNHRFRQEVVKSHNDNIFCKLSNCWLSKKVANSPGHSIFFNFLTGNLLFIKSS